MILSERDIERLQGKLVRDEKSGCLLWTGYRANFGHGRMRIGKQCYYVHRVAWVAAGLEIPVDRPFILHKCDTPACCDVDHLWAGTRADNAEDMARKRRGNQSAYGLPRGVRHCTGSVVYYAECTVRKKRIYLGTFKTVEEASAAVENEKKKHLTAPLY